MKKPQAKENNLIELLKQKKYYIDDYQREYKWEERQIKELISDLADKFLEDYTDGNELKEVKNYGSYFLGSIVISDKGNNEYIVDGQQRITSLILLLIYINNRINEKGESGKIDVLTSLIYSQSYGENSYNLDVSERNDCMNALFRGQEDEFNTKDKSESVINLINRYKDIEEIFPESIDDCLIHFAWWLIENVYLVKITSFSDDDAYIIFETMNDRGLSLDSTEMLKGFLLAGIDTKERTYSNEIWKKRIKKFNEMGKEEATDFFKNWFRAKYAETTREKKKEQGGYILKDFEIIGNAYHKWIRDNKEIIGLKSSEEFYNFINVRFDFYSNLYIKIRNYEKKFDENYAEVYFNAHNNFTLQSLVIFAAIKVNDNEKTIDKKIKLVSKFIDIFIARSLVNFRSLGYSYVMYKIFKIAKDVRDLEIDEILDYFKTTLNNLEDKFDGMNRYRLNKQNRVKVHYLLARITYFIEKESGIPSNFENYINKGKHKPFEIEHIIPDKFEEYKDFFNSEDDFENTRNKLGNLILLQRGTNQSLGDAKYTNKKVRYMGENLLAQSLCENSIASNPNYTNFIRRSNLNFKPYDKFEKNEILERNELYKSIFECIWSTDKLYIKN
ncbi:MAG: hypothetical protein B6I28_04725 [Fusobacteriia bacterium 4572_132]|nr:MAG: hypothetical protein B6I28_04725 [Fusobacteriia bacterium 4572_132]